MKCYRSKFSRRGDQGPRPCAPLEACVFTRAGMDVMTNGKLLAPNWKRTPIGR